MQDKREKIITNAIGIERNIILTGLITLGSITLLNLKFTNINLIWNISFILPLLAILIANIIVIKLCTMNVYYEVYKNIEDKLSKSCKRLSNIILTSNILSFVYLGIFITYIVLTIIFFV